MLETGKKFRLIKPQEPGGSSKLVMVIDDVDDILALFEDILTLEGHRVSLYYSSNYNIQDVKRVKPDLIISDYYFTYSKAKLDFLEKLSANKLTQDIPVILCTTDTGLVQAAPKLLTKLRLAVISKPFFLDELINLVRKLLD
jgi:DNA-binding NtrC family response regulator